MKRLWSVDELVTYTPIGTATLSDVDPQAWLVDVLARIADNPLRDLMS